MHETFSRASFWVAMFEIPACGFEGRFGGAGGVIFVGVAMVLRSGAVAGIFVL